MDTAKLKEEEINGSQDTILNDYRIIQEGVTKCLVGTKLLGEDGMLAELMSLLI